MNNPISSEYMVRVECMTYNHAPYIEDAMNGFCMQETNFPFVCVIVDDASTDGEPEVIKKYLNNNFDLQNGQFFREEDTDDYELIFARHKTNLNCYFGVLLLKYNHWGKKDKTPYYESWSKAKYIALCEGDDYWIYPHKLQMQVNYLEINPDVSYSCARYNDLNCNTNSVSLAPNYYFDAKEHQTEDSFRFTREYPFSKQWITKTLTCVFRKSAFDPSFYRRFKYRRDVHLVYNILSNGDGVCFSFVCGVYRKHPMGIFGGLSDLDKIKTNYKVFSEMSSFLRDPIINRMAKNHYQCLLELGNRPFPQNAMELNCSLQNWRLYWNDIVVCLKLHIYLPLKQQLYNKYML